MAYEFSEGLATVKINKRQGYVDSAGNLVISTQYLRAATFSEGLAAVDIGTGSVHKTIADACETGFINRQGDFAIKPQFLSVGRFKDEVCHVENEKYIGYIDKSGDFVWKSGWADIGLSDPHHNLPPERSINSVTSIN
jgi:hypothetical protein